MVTTEFGKMEVKPNEICIIQVNICCKQITLDCCSVIKVVSTGQCLPRFGNAHFVFEEGRSKLVKRKKLALNPCRMPEFKIQTQSSINISWASVSLSTSLLFSPTGTRAAIQIT